MLHPHIAEVTGVTRLVAYVTAFSPINQSDLCPSRQSFPLLPSHSLHLSFFAFPIPPIMPSGVGVVETFKSLPFSGTELRFSYLTPLSDPDLIRHGKAHQGQRQDGMEVDFVSPEQQRQHRTVLPKERDALDGHRHHHEPKDHKKTSDYSREAEMIVQEERQAKNNVPQYKGLERYRILEKMGESVAPHVMADRSGADPPRPQWCILKCVQGSRHLDWTESCQYDRMLLSIPLTHFYSLHSQNCSEIRVELAAG